ncbi:MAG: KamA family radical SAM protein [Desulfobacteraceae bacterium]|nr:KamA family radical SAM protein [Desulfobacteraceae bacterium]
MDDGTSLIQCYSKDAAKDEIQEDFEEPPGILLSLTNLHPRPQEIITPRQTAVVLPFVVRRQSKTSSKTKAFRRKFFPNANDKEWNNWHWQINHRIHTILKLRRFLNLSTEETDALGNLSVKLPLGITPYYMSLISREDPDSPLRRTVVPTVHEFFKTPEEADDPLCEDRQSPVPGLVHRYPDRVLLLAHDFCSTYCRYCTRSRVVGHGRLYPSRNRLEKAIDYIRADTQIRDVLISGGDPLTLSDDRLNWILTKLRQIPHVEIVRIGTKVPAVLPQRITPQLVRMLRRHHPIWMSLHFIHPDECTPEAYRACAMLADAGIPLNSQTVLLAGINDTVDTMTELMHHLLKMRVRPYYLYQCDPISGSSHFRTPVEKGLEIIRGLRGFTSGYAVPTYVIDAPGGGGKIPVMPDYVMGRDSSEWTLRNYEGKTFKYPDPQQRIFPSFAHSSVIHEKVEDVPLK